jgi:hypothetical protein
VVKIYLRGIVMSILDQIKTLEKGKGIQYLLDAAYKIFGNPIVMFDTNYTLKAFTEDVNDDPLWNTLISTGTFSMTDQEFFTSERFTENAANADKLVVMKSNKLKYDRILGNIFNSEHIKVANIVMVECKLPFGVDIQAAFEVFADKVTDEIKNDNYYTVYGREYHDSIIKKLLERRIIDTVMYTPHVQILYDGFKDYLYIAVIDINFSGNNQSKKNHDQLIEIKDMLINIYPSFKFAIYSGYILMIMSSKFDNFSSEIILGSQENIFVQNNLFAGISTGFENLYEVDKYYNEAVTALKNGINTVDSANTGKNQRIFMYTVP